MNRNRPPIFVALDPNAIRVVVITYAGAQHRREMTIHELASWMDRHGPNLTPPIVEVLL